MSDFLGHLVARTIAQPSLRPRTRSRFEAPSIEEAPLVWPETTPVTAEPHAAAQTTTVTTPAQNAAPEPDRRRLAGWVNGVSPLTGGRRDDAAPAGEDASGPGPEKLEPETRVVIEHDVQRIVETNERVVPVAARPHRFDEQPPRIIERRGSREIEERHNERVIHTATDRMHRIAGKAQPIESTAAPEPVIQVSIGRIEVRAVTSAPPSRNAPRGASPMTIDDYVAKRKAKERR